MSLRISLSYELEEMIKLYVWQEVLQITSLDLPSSISVPHNLFQDLISHTLVLRNLF